MAIEFLRAQMVTRGKDLRGAPAHLAYRNCSRIYDERADRTFDYSNKKSVLDSFLVNAGDNTLEQLANKMEHAEKRKDAQVAREFILALPHELSLEVNREICEAFLKPIVAQYKIAAHVAIHKPDELRKNESHRSTDSLKNIHAHITITTRSIDENGNIFGPKIREMNDRGYLEGLKTQVRELMNQALKEHGFSPIEVRDPFLKPTVHLGPHLTRMERRGTSSLKGDTNRLIEKINEINSKLQALEKEEEVIKKGSITVDGMTYKDFPYPKGKEFKPYELAFKSYSELCREMGEGRVRVKERYDDKMIRSLMYQGQEISVAELALINPNFMNQALSTFEQTLSEKPKIFKQRNMSGVEKSNNNEEQRQRKAWVNLQRLGAISSRKPYIQQINTDAQVAEALWYGQQAAYAMEQGDNIRN